MNLLSLKCHPHHPLSKEAPHAGLSPYPNAACQMRFFVSLTDTLSTDSLHQSSCTTTFIRPANPFTNPLVESILQSALLYSPLLSIRSRNTQRAVDESTSILVPVYMSAPISIAIPILFPSSAFSTNVPAPLPLPCYLVPPTQWIKHGINFVTYHRPRHLQLRNPVSPRCAGLPTLRSCLKVSVPGPSIHAT